MLTQLRHHAEESANALWGLSGPHDAPRYHELPDSGNFFKDNIMSWQSPYGDFFLSWYAGQLVGHGDHILDVANGVLGDKPAELSAKVSFMHWWHDARSRPAEAVAGFYKSNQKNRYSPVAKMFTRHVCMNKQHHITGASPDQLLVQIKNACRRHGARIAGENAFSRIRSNLLTVERTQPSHFTYQRMGTDFFSPEHWPPFMEFMRGVLCGEWDEDELADEERNMASTSANANARETQAV
ncbi:hypothetical protein GUJ93_ZPchr0013g34783 [Zizania palustris]|uniref:Beta-amylase n=1 Tax=Zizania palustris TaxID=103762 RepID=A0A8J6BUJ1_ZIZPA|nr:hypothetical protein GUJ93_ZPchr0013g34783 [Zizania palustris]